MMAELFEIMTTHTKRLLVEQETAVKALKQVLNDYQTANKQQGSQQGPKKLHLSQQGLHIRAIPSNS